VAPEGEDELARLQASFNLMAEELEKANQALVAQRDRVAGLLRAQRELTASVSHELRTPVTTALAYLENDLDHLDTLPREDLQHDLEVTRHEVERLQHLIDDLFTLSKAEINQLSLEMTAIDLEPLVRRALDAPARMAWENRRVRIQAELPGSLSLVWADAGRVEQILKNLLANGVRHTAPGGFVVVSAESQSGAVRVTVTDSGEGIDPQDLPHVWERFYRGAGSTGDGRTGLGLAIVKELVESMGGIVAVTSEPDQGSTFSFELRTCGAEHPSF
jgi:signal transduction histidine kinase